MIPEYAYRYDSAQNEQCAAIKIKKKLEIISGVLLMKEYENNYFYLKILNDQMKKMKVYIKSGNSEIFEKYLILGKAYYFLDWDVKSEK